MGLSRANAKSPADYDPAVQAALDLVPWELELMASDPRLTKATVKAWGHE